MIPNTGMPSASLSPPAAGHPPQAQPVAPEEPAAAAQAPTALHSGLEILERTREIARRRLAPLAEAIDREGLYPREVLAELAAAGAFSGHLRSHGQPGDLGLAIETIAAVAEVCGSTGFVAWCHAACGLYLEESGNPALQDHLLAEHIAGRRLGGTGLSNPMKTYAGIEKQLLRAVPDGDGYRLRGLLPWVSHLSADGYCAVMADIVDADPGGVADASGAAGTAGRQVMVLLPGTAPGVELVRCPTFSGMEGTSTYAIRLRDHRVGADRVIADPALPFIQRIRNAFVLLQCGFGLGVIQGAIASMRAVAGPLGHVNRFLDDGPEQLDQELAELRQRLQRLARVLDPGAPSPPPAQARERRIAVLEARAASSELALRAAQSALLHQGARGYLASAEAQRRVRESHFVAIVTPALKHLRKEIAQLRNPTLPEPASAPLPSTSAR